MLGGFPILFILVFGVAALVSASRLVMRPRVEAARHLWMLIGGLACASVAGVCGDLYMATERINRSGASGELLARMVIVGFGESLWPAILGFSFAAAALVIGAVGVRRIPAS